jgi:hypothetical protein
MLLTVKKQIEETVELNTPACYKSFLGYYFINESGTLVAVKKNMVYVWGQEYGYMYTEAIAEILRDGESCERSEFDNAYNGAIQNIQSAINAVVI